MALHLAYVRQIAQIQITELRALPEASNKPEEKALLEEGHGRVNVFNFSGPLSFGAAADLGHHVRQHVKPGSEVLILD